MTLLSPLGLERKAILQGVHQLTSSDLGELAGGGGAGQHPVVIAAVGFRVHKALRTLDCAAAGQDRRRLRGAIDTIGGRIATSTWRSELFVAIHIRERPIAFDTILP
jgi:hypothetical protein